jgi:hypothetical protein
MGHELAFQLEREARKTSSAATLSAADVKELAGNWIGGVETARE